jgi:hypothetical protein
LIQMAWKGKIWSRLPHLWSHNSSLCFIQAHNNFTTD